ncbi:MAG: Tex family protein [Pirellulales bacterium]
MSSAITIDLRPAARDLGLPESSVAAAVRLLDEGNTVPFITRYRRDQTGGLDEEQIELVRGHVAKLRQLEERKQTILRSLESQEKLTDALRAEIGRAASMKRLEDLYLPFKPKKQSLAAKAREQGLAPLAEEILMRAPTCAELQARAAEFVDAEKGVADAAAAIAGAGHIIAEQFSELADLRQHIRKLYRKTAKLVSKGVEEEHKQKPQFKDYLDFREPLSRIPPHRVLAINRGERAKVLRVSVDVDEQAIERLAIDDLISADHPHREYLDNCVRDALARLVLPSLEREARRETTEKAETHAVTVFARNLRKLLLQPPLAGKRVLAIDPGYKNGCKLATLDDFGNLLKTGLVHLVGSDEQKAKARETLVETMREHPINVIAIGNGSACRATEELVGDILANELAESEIRYVIVNEAGASVYSTSPTGREEFPECDAMQRSAISIGRRLQDPLSELVKIDPASIGVGLYQHDARTGDLRDTLNDVVQACVSFVGVDLNRASTALLRYVSGLNQLTARRIQEFRQQQGPFKSRQQLMEVNGLGEATFVQAAGFLKIESGDEPLDATWVHPESYDAARTLLARLGVDVAALGKADSAATIETGLAAHDRAALAQELGVGQLTLEQLVEALSKPGRDPRTDLPPPLFRKDVVKFEDLAVGIELRGTVLNVVDFGAFVDVGLSDSGLVHISQLSNDYVRDPHQLVSVGDQVQVWVASIDPERRRVSLTMIPPGTERKPEPRPPRQERPPRRPPPQKAAEQQPAGSLGASPSAATPATRPQQAPSRRKQQFTPRHDPPQHGHADRPAFEKRAKKVQVPITKEMAEGKEAMRSFGDLLQFHKKKQEPQAEETGDGGKGTEGE